MTKEEALEELKEIRFNLNYKVNGTSRFDKALNMAIKLLEQEPSSSEKPNKWIPVSERLPEEAGMYLCSYDDDYVGTSYFDIRMNEFNVFHEQVTAWMPLPPSYQGE